MRRTGKDQWHKEPSVLSSMPGAAYVAVAIGVLCLAMYSGWSKGQSESLNAAQNSVTVETAKNEPLLSNLFGSIRREANSKTQPLTNEGEPSATPKALTQTKPAAQTQPLEQQEQQEQQEQLAWQTLKVKSGDSFSSLMERAGFSTQAWYEVVQLGSDTKALTQLRVGESLKVAKDGRRVAALDYRLNAEDTLQLRRQDDALVITTHKSPIERRTVSAAGTIETAFYLAADKAGLPDNIIMELADLFAWDINFALNTRSGDSFSVLYEEKYQEGKKIGTGHILAAEFINKGKSYRTLRYTDAGGKTNYYTPDGRSMRRAFLRSPVHFTRISSRFNPNRLHPIYKTKRPHRGVDYAAPRGTPIMSSGDGVVTFAGNKTGYGKVVIIKHGERYSTLYAHMNRISKGMRRGKRVSQGQVIGRVGSTGWATGPHLHYEFRVDGAHRNPLTVKLPLAQPIKKRYRQDFNAYSQPMMAWLDALAQTQLALQDR